jgi:hypothetical protein
VKTMYDLVTMAIFAGLVVLFLQRSAGQQTADDRLYQYQYLPPAVGLALANWLGNQQQNLLAIGVIVAVIAYVAVVLKPFKQHL